MDRKRRCILLLAGMLLCGGPVVPGVRAMDNQATDNQAMMRKAHAPAETGKYDPAAWKVEKAAGKDAYDIAEIHAKAARLDGKTVAVRGKVFKATKKIMGRHWVHLRDGSGTEEKGNHNLVVTTQDPPEAGATVTARGRLAKDRDFGASYRYAVIVEDATIER